MGGTRVPLARTFSLNFYFPCLLSDERGSDARALLLPLDASWTKARLISSHSIEIAGRAVSCSDLEPLHTIAGGKGDGQGLAFLRSLAVRSNCTTPSASSGVADSGSSSVSCSGSRTDAVANNSTAAQIWAELDVEVRPKAHICANPILRPAWRLLLPWLITCTREEAPAMPTLSIAYPPVETSASPAVQVKSRCANSSEDKGFEVRALEAVYASLKPGEAGSVLREDGGADSSVGRGPGALGLNALPAAVVMIGKWILCLGSGTR